ncbi:Nn.00g109380.m01.CDS01 [Neocucurbitaria sp. VM-36]
MPNRGVARQWEGLDSPKQLSDGAQSAALYMHMGIRDPQSSQRLTSSQSLPLLAPPGRVAPAIAMLVATSVPM